MRDARFTDRTEAGRELADALSRFGDRDDVVVHALPRGGVPVGYEVAVALDAPLDVIVVRKIGAPGHEELAMGAVASGGAIVRNERVIADLGIDDATFDHVARRKRGEVRERELRFRGGRPAPPVEGKTVIVVDDGIATGSTIQAAVRVLRPRAPSHIVVAVPVAPRDAIDLLREIADEVVCLVTPTPFLAVGSYYREFSQVQDYEVRGIRDDAAAYAAGPGAS
jgi:predicted phosphoribosyltransferase